MFTTVTIPVMADHLSPKKHQQLERLTGRDSTIIHCYLQIIQNEEASLWRKNWEGKRLNPTKLDALTLTSIPLTRKQKDGTVKTTRGRSIVKYDLKHQFKRRITVRELKECRDTAIAMWHSYLEKLAKYEQVYWRIMQKSKYVEREEALARVLHWWATEKKPSAPCQAAGYPQTKLPRRANVRTTAFLHERPTKLTRYWLELYFPERGKHLWLPLNPSSYHINQLTRGKPQTVQVVKQANGRWTAHLTLTKHRPKLLKHMPLKPLAVVGIDLGIEKAAVAVLLTATEKGRVTRKTTKFFKQQEKKQAINAMDYQIAALQRKTEQYRKLGRSIKQLLRALKRLSHKRQALAIQYDHQLTAELVAWIHRLEHRYTVHIVLGQLKGIRHSRRKGDGGSRSHRRKLHRWAFARITEMLRYKLYQVGVPEKRFRTVREAWTSRTCSQCGSHKTMRPFQALTICLTCGFQLQADVNGAINIGCKLIISLDGTMLDHWLHPPSLHKKYPERETADNQLLKNPLPFRQTLERNVSVGGRKTSRTQETSLISRPLCGDEAPSPVDLSFGDRGVEPTSRKPDNGKFLSS